MEYLYNAKEIELSTKNSMSSKKILQEWGKIKTPFSQTVIERIHHQQNYTKENTKEYSVGRGKMKLDGSS